MSNMDVTTRSYKDYQLMAKNQTVTAGSHLAELAITIKVSGFPDNEYGLDWMESLIDIIQGPNYAPQRLGDSIQASQ